MFVPISFDLSPQKIQGTHEPESAGSIYGPKPQIWNKA